MWFRKVVVCFSVASVTAPSPKRLYRTTRTSWNGHPAIYGLSTGPCNHPQTSSGPFFGTRGVLGTMNEALEKLQAASNAPTDLAALQDFWGWQPVVPGVVGIPSRSVSFFFRMGGSGGRSHKQMDSLGRVS